MRVLITGAQGWLGRFTAAAFLREPETEVLGLGRSAYHSCFSHRLPNGHRAPLPHDLVADGPGYSYQSCDLRDGGLLRKLLVEFQPSHVLHLAGAVSGSDTESLEQLNVVATESLFEAVAALDARPRIIMASTGSIYGEPAYLPQDEHHPINPVLDYARSKWKAERVALSCADRIGQAIPCARIFNLVGPGTPSSLLPGTLALQLASVAYGLQPPVIRMGPLDSVRDYVDVRDCAEALHWLCHCDLTGMSAVNIASGTGTPITRVWEQLRDIARRHGGPPIEVAALPPFPAHSSTHIGGTRRLAALGFRCTAPLERSLNDLYDWALAALKPSERKGAGSTAEEHAQSLQVPAGQR